MSEKELSKEAFTERIMERILSGQFKPGDQLPPERELAKDMGISRNMVSSGIRELCRRGFLIVLPRQGTFVNDFRAEGNLFTLMTLMESSTYTLNDAEIKSILDIRWAVEQLIVHGAVTQATDMEIRKLGTLADRILETDSPEAAAAAAFHYQHELAVISRNTIIPMFLQGFRPAIESMWIRYAKNYGIQQLYQSTAELFWFIRERDLEGAREQIDRSTVDVTKGDHCIYRDL